MGQMSIVIGVTTVGTQRAMREIQLMEATVKKAQVSMMQLGRSMTQFASLPAGIFAGAALANFAKFEFSIAKIVGLVGIADEQAKAWGKDILNVAGDVGKGANELADALYYITSSGFKGAESMKILEVSAKAAASGLGETKTVADIVTSAMNAYGASALSAAEATNVLVMAVREGKGEPEDLTRAFATVIPISAKLDVQFHEVGGALAALTRLGMPAATAATYLRQTLFTLTKPSKQTRDALKAMGTSAGELRDSLENQGLLPTLRTLGDLTERFGEESMSRVFPNIRAFMGVISLLQMDVAEVNEVFENTKNSSSALSDAFAAASETLKFKLNAAVAEGQSMLIKFGEALSRSVLPIVESLGRAFKDFGDWFGSLSKGTQDFIAKTLGIVIALGPLLLVLKLLKSGLVELWAGLKYIFKLGFIKGIEQTTNNTNANTKATTEAANAAKKAAAATVASTKATKAKATATSQANASTTVFITNLSKATVVLQKFATTLGRIVTILNAYFHASNKANAATKTQAANTNAQSSAWNNYSTGAIKATIALTQYSESSKRAFLIMQNMYLALSDGRIWVASSQGIYSHVKALAEYSVSTQRAMSVQQQMLGSFSRGSVIWEATVNGIRKVQLALTLYTVSGERLIDTELRMLGSFSRGSVIWEATSFGIRNAQKALTLYTVSGERLIDTELRMLGSFSRGNGVFIASEIGIISNVKALDQYSVSSRRVAATQQLMVNTLIQGIGLWESNTYGILHIQKALTQYTITGERVAVIQQKMLGTFIEGTGVFTTSTIYINTAQKAISQYSISTEHFRRAQQKLLGVLVEGTKIFIASALGIENNVKALTQYTITGERIAVIQQKMLGTLTQSAIIWESSAIGIRNAQLALGPHVLTLGEASVATMALVDQLKMLEIMETNIYRSISFSNIAIEQKTASTLAMEAAEAKIVVTTTKMEAAQARLNKTLISSNGVIVGSSSNLSTNLRMLEERTASGIRAERIQNKLNASIENGNRVFTVGTNGVIAMTRAQRQQLRAQEALNASVQRGSTLWYAYSNGMVSNKLIISRKEILNHRRALQAQQSGYITAGMAAANYNKILANSPKSIGVMTFALTKLSGVVKGLGVVLSTVSKFIVANWFLALILIGPAIVKLITKTKELTGAQKLLKDANDKVAESISSEKSRLETLLSIAQNENISKELRGKAIKEINKISPEYLGNLDEEAVRLGTARTAIDAYNSSLSARLAFEIKLGEIAELRAKRDKVLREGGEAQIGFWDRIKGALKFGAIPRPSQKGQKFEYLQGLGTKKMLKEVADIDFAITQLNAEIAATPEIRADIIHGYKTVQDKVNALISKEKELKNVKNKSSKEYLEESAKYQSELRNTILLAQEKMGKAKNEIKFVEETVKEYKKLGDESRKGIISDEGIRRLEELQTMMNAGFNLRVTGLNELRKVEPELKKVIESLEPKLKQVNEGGADDFLGGTAEKLSELEQLQKSLTEAFANYETQLKTVDIAAQLYGKTTGIAADKIGIMESVINLAAEAQANGLIVDKAKLDVVIQLYNELSKLNDEEKAKAKILEDGLEVQKKQYEAWEKYYGTGKRLVKANDDLNNSLAEMSEYVKYSGGEFTMAQAAVEIYTDYIKNLRAELKGGNKQEIWVQILNAQQKLKKAKLNVVIDEYRRSLELLEIEATIAGGSFATFGETLGFLENAYKALLDEGIRSGEFFDTVVSGMMELRNLANTKDTFNELGSAFGELVSIFDLGKETWVSYVETILNAIPKIIEMIMSLTAATTLENTINAARVESINNTQVALLNETMLLETDTEAIKSNTNAIVANTLAKQANAAVGMMGTGSTMGPPTQEQMIGGSSPTAGLLGVGGAAANVGTGVSAVSGLGQIAKIAGNFSAILGGVMGVISILSLLFKKKKKAGMAHGGIVPQGYPNDSYPAMLSSGEAVIPPHKLPEFENREMEVKVVVEGVTKGSDLYYVMKEVSRRYKNSF